MPERFLPAIALLGLALAHTSALAQPGPSLERHTAIYDPPRQRMIVFGGNAGSQFTNDTWQLDLGPNPQWTQLNPSGTPPSSRFGHAAVYDPRRDRMIVIGGFDGSYLADVWELSLSGAPQWNLITPADSAPAGHRYHSAIYDPVRDRVVIYGGQTQGGVPAADAWSLWLSPAPRWEQITPVGDPPVARFNHSAVYDRVRDCMIVYGGGPIAQRDLAELSLGGTPAWTALPNPPDPRRQAHSAVYDAARNRMVLFGGNDANQSSDELWMMTPGVAPTWTELFPGGPPEPRSFHTAILDSVYQRMIVFGGFPNATEPTWGLSLESPTHWSPLRPLLAVPASLSLPPVTVGDTVSATLAVTNRGLSPLGIGTMQMPPGMSFDVPAPFQLGWNETRTGALQLVASTSGAREDSVVIESNDPLTPRAVVRLSMEVRALDFGARVLGDPTEVPLGSSFIVVVTPEPGVRIERATLYYSVANASSFDSLTLTPLGTDFVGAVPASAVTERGVDYYVRVENSGYFAWRPAGAPGAVLTQPVARADSIRGIPRPDFVVGRPIEVEVGLPLGSIFESGAIHYRRGGETTYRTDALATDELGRPIAVIPDTIVGARGVEYWIDVTTFGGPLRFKSDQAPATIRITVHDLVEPVVHPGMRYRLLSVPLDFGENSTSTLADLLTDQLGVYDPVRWRCYRYDPTVPGNVELSSSTLDAFHPAPGAAFWLISRDGHRVDTSPVQGLSTSTDREYPIPLDLGWNAFGNPFDFPVSWDDVRRDSIAVGEPVAFDWTRGSIGDYADEPPAVLAPFEGYFVHATEKETLWVRPRAVGPLTTQAVVRASGRSTTSWRFRLRALTQSAQDGANEFGIGGAETGFDVRRWRKPPRPPGPWVRIGFVRPEEVAEATLRRDLRPAGAAGETWEIEVRSESAGEVVTVEAVEVDHVPNGLAMRLIDRETGEIVARAGGGVAFRYRLVSLGARPYRLAIVAGTEEYVAEALQEGLAIPTRVTLDPNAPNPFRNATRIRFGLPGTHEVSLEVFSVLGQRIAVPIDRSRLAAGHHSVVWDGTTAAGDPAPAGVYLLRLRVGKETVVRRAIRLP